MRTTQKNDTIKVRITGVTKSKLFRLAALRTLRTGKKVTASDVIRDKVDAVIDREIASETARGMPA